MDSVLIIGAGQAGVEAACSLRERGFPGTITVLGEEDGTPYQRPPLSKDLQAGGELPLLPLRSPAVLAELGVTLLDGVRAVAIDRVARTVKVLDAAGAPGELGYDHLVLATGARPRGLGQDGGALPGQDAAGVHVLRTAADAKALAGALTSASGVCIVGGGVIGLEFATIAAAVGLPTTVLERGDRFLRRFVGQTSAAWLHAAHAARGVRIVTGASVASLRVNAAGAVEAVELADGGLVPADLVLVGTGVLPASELAAAAGLSTEGGVVVDARLRTADPRISAIGDCAAFPSRFTPGVGRVECVQNATDQARYLALQLAALAAAEAGPHAEPHQGTRPETAATDPGTADDAVGHPGAQHEDLAPYDDVPWFWSVQAGVKIQVAGIAGHGDAEVVIGDPAAGKFSVLRFAGQELTCVESIGRPADHLTARRLLAAGDGPTLDDALAGRVDTLKAWSAAVPA